jgi:predicted DNA-binding transcriptional regulator YafY
MRASRLVALLLAVQRHGSTTAPALAAELEVSVRTVYRDIAALQQAGVPLWTEPGPHGGVRLVEGWRTRLDGLTGDEAAALFLAGAPSSAVAELGLGTVLAAAQSKVLSTLPPELRGRAARVRDRFHLDAPGWFQRGEQHPHLGTVADAAWRDRRLRLQYRRGNDSVQRTVDPLGLVLKAGMWYLVARTRRGVVTYRVSRIAHAEVLHASFERPASFELGEWWDASGAEFDRSLRRVRARVRLSGVAVRRLADAVGLLAAREALATATAPDDDGWVTVEVDVESAEVAADQLFALGDGVEALAPPELRDRLRTAATALASRNA